MPGPSNSKKKRKCQGKKKRNINASIMESRPTLGSVNSTPSRSPNHPLTPSLLQQQAEEQDVRVILPDDILEENYEAFHMPNTIAESTEKESAKELPLLPQTPFIHDPGNGPRVRDTHAFLASKFFAQPPALDVPLCAEFAKEEVLEMLMTILPEETALILWYNKSRATSRICPACQRLYHLGDDLPEIFSEGATAVPTKPQPSPKLRREQMLSGLCSPACFVMASLNYPGAIQPAWGRNVEEIDDDTWDIISQPTKNKIGGELGSGLSMLMRMTRLHDLGLAQLCLGLDTEDLEFMNVHDPSWDERY